LEALLELCRRRDEPTHVNILLTFANSLIPIVLDAYNLLIIILECLSKKRRIEIGLLVSALLQRDRTEKPI
jgi:hypothetical protein